MSAILKCRSVTNALLALPSVVASGYGHSMNSNTVEQAYDLRKLLQVFNADPRPYLDYPEFCEPVQVKFISDSKGRGLVTTRNVEAGELLIVSTAVDFVYSSSLADAKKSLQESASSDKYDQRAKSALVERLWQRCSNSSDARSSDLQMRLCSLFAGSHSHYKPTAPGIVSSRTNDLRIDKNRIEAVVKHNMFSDSYLTDQRVSGFGLWYLPSFANHACLCSAVQACFGNVMFVRAVQNIPSGGEVSIAYCPQGMPFEERRRLFQDVYGFTCDCALCMHDNEFQRISPGKVRSRKEYAEYFDAYVRPQTDSSRRAAKISPALVSELEFSVRYFERNLAFKKRADPLFYELVLALGEAYLLSEKTHLAIKAFQRAFYIMTVGFPNAANNHEESYIPATTSLENVSLALKISRLLAKSGDDSAAVKWRKDALSSFKLLYGTDDKEVFDIMTT